MVDPKRLEAAKDKAGSWGRFSEIVGVSAETVNRYRKEKYISAASIEMIEEGIVKIESGDLSIGNMRSRFGNRRTSDGDGALPKYAKKRKDQAEETAVVPQADGNVEVMTRDVMALIRREAATLREQQSMSERFLRMALEIIELEKDAQASQAEVRAMQALMHRGK